MLALTFRSILVTGSAGVTGTAVRELKDEYPRTQFVFLTSSDCDLTDAASTLRTFDRIAPDAILHLAAVSGGIGLSLKCQASMLRDNVLMTISVLEAARRLNIAKTLMTLTTGMYPPEAPLPLSESSIHDGQPHDSNYGSSFAKRLIEPAIRGYREQYELPVIGVIPNGIFGQNDNFNYDDAPMLPALIRRFYESRNTSHPIVIWGDGSALREYTYSRDVAQAFLWALHNYDEAQVLNTGTTEEHTVAEIAFMIADIMSIDRRRIAFDGSRPSGVHRKSTDNSRFLEISHFRYTPFRQGLERTIHWFRDVYESTPHLVRLYGKGERKST